MMTRKRPNTSYRSGFEGTVISNLRRRKIPHKYEPERIRYVIEHDYIPDVKLDNGIYVELKGRLTVADRRKTLAVIKQNKGIDLRFCFQSAHNKLYKGAKSTYAEWCDKYKIKWCQGEIPDEWINEKPKRKPYKRRKGTV